MGSRSPSSGSLASWRQHAPMVPLEEIARLRVPQGRPDEVPIPPGVQARLMAARVSRLTFNLALISLVLLILAVPIYIGLHRVAELYPVAKTSNSAVSHPLVPTATLADGFSGYSSTMFSVTYPAGWQHTVANLQAGGANLRVDQFQNSQNGAFKVYTTTAVPADELQPLVMAVVGATTGGATPQPTAVNLQKTYHEIVWVENDYTLAQVHGSTVVQVNERVLAIDRGVTTYVIIASAPQTAFAHDNSIVFEPMLQSLRLP